MQTQINKMNSEQLSQARDWIKECIPCFRDLESEEDVDELTDAEVERGIEKHYDGGIAAFNAA